MYPTTQWIKEAPYEEIAANLCIRFCAITRDEFGEAMMALQARIDTKKDKRFQRLLNIWCEDHAYLMTGPNMDGAAAQQRLDGNMKDKQGGPIRGFDRYNAHFTGWQLHKPDGGYGYWTADLMYPGQKDIHLYLTSSDNDNKTKRKMEAIALEVLRFQIGGRIDLPTTNKINPNTGKVDR